MKKWVGVLKEEVEKMIEEVFKLKETEERMIEKVLKLKE